MTERKAKSDRKKGKSDRKKDTSEILVGFSVGC
jgi:hypothetical protein